MKVRFLKVSLNPIFIICQMILILSLVSCRDPEIHFNTGTQENQTNIISDDLPEIFPFPTNEIQFGTNLRFDHISIEDGLSQNTVFCMLQDSQGFMWFGTEDGLNKYDGYSFTVFKNIPDDPNSLSGDWILSMMEDNQGRLWVGTLEAGLNQYDRGTGQFKRFQNNPDEPTSLSDDQVTTIYQDTQGFIWIGTGNGGLNKLNEDGEGFTHFQYSPENSNSLSSNAVSVIAEDKDGTLWVGTEDNGLNKFSPREERWWHYSNDPNDLESLSNNRIQTIFFDSAGVLWVGTDGGGLDKYDTENDRFIHFQYDPENSKTISGDRVSSVFQDNEGILWIGTIGNGLNQYNSVTNTFYRYQQLSGDSKSLSNNHIVSIFQDREGGLWFGTFSAGLNKLSAGWDNFYLYQHEKNNPNSLSENMIWAIFSDAEDNLWVGTMTHGVDYFDRLNYRWEHFSHVQEDPGSLSDNFVSALYQDNSGNVWIGTASGLNKYDSDSRSFTHYQPEPDTTTTALENNIWTIFQNSEGQFWIGTRGGLYQFDPITNRWNSHYDINPEAQQSLSDSWVFSFMEDQDGNHWLGTYTGGLNLLNLDPGTFTAYQHDDNDPSSLSSNFIMAIFQDSQGTLWVGSPGGLDKFDPESETFTHYREEDGLPNNTVYCILEDGDGYLWLSTNYGLSRFNPQNEIFTNYDVSDGLQSNEFNARACYKNEKGEMFFGGIDGFNTFLPANIHTNEIIPPVVITSISSNSQEIILESVEDGNYEVTLKWPANSFAFEYAALSFTNPAENQYAYYLDGFEDTWKEVGTRRFGEYTNLPGGSYTLRVKGTNNDGVWNEAGVAVQITIVPPFWQTGWFYGTITLVILGLFYGGYRLRVNSLEARGRELESQVERRTSELMQAQAHLKQIEMEKAISDERNRLARDLHDSVTQSIYSLTLLSEAGQRMVQSGDLIRVEENQIRLGEISQQALQEMRLLVYELRPQILEDEGLVGALENRLSAVERRAGINAKLHHTQALDIPQHLEKELFHITMEALNNALKHAKASEVVLSIQSYEDFIIVEIEDNGRGFDPRLVKGQGGIGLSSMTERTEKIGGSLSIQSQEGAGTIVTVRVPLKSEPESFNLNPEENDDK